MMRMMDAVFTAYWFASLLCRPLLRNVCKSVYPH